MTENFNDNATMTGEEFETYRAKMKAAGREVDAFFETIPVWVDESRYFDLYMMNDSEREAYYKANAPVQALRERLAEQSAAPYLKASSNRPTERVGRIRIS